MTRERHSCPRRSAQQHLAALGALGMVALAAVVAPACSCGENLAVVPGGATGRVCDAETGVGLVDVTVTLTARNGRTATAVTAADGGWRVNGVAPGAAAVEAVIDDGVRTFDVEIASGDIAVVVDPACREPPGAPGLGGVVGQVCNRHTGALVSDALVIVLLADSTTRETFTDDQGRFSLEDLPAGDAVVTIRGTGYQRSFAVTVADGVVTELDLGESCIETGLDQGTLSGALCDPAGGPLVGARVTAVDDTGFSVSDLTDTDGEFFLNALAPGPALVDVSRAPDINTTYTISVVAGRDTVVVRDLACAEECSYQVTEVAAVGVRPVDIIFVIDDSGSMGDDNDAVQANINDFSTSIAASGTDARVILVGTTNVPPPLGGSGEFLKINTSVDSNDALIELVQNHAQYASFLRADSIKHFVAITDDESDMSAAAFTATVNGWAGFENGWVFHSIVAYGSDPQDGCSTGAAYGHQYMTLSQQTGGITSPICDANYATVFDAVVEAVTVGTLPCTIAIPAPPGVEADASQVTVTVDGANGPSLSMPVGVTCAGPGWTFDDAANPTAVLACPETCAAISRDASGSLTVTVGCR
ncbi:MAG: carboxypeptidase regulatory-like domain-containing protein [Deltaproteobacteria bacterium]|nr:carboxypeptidase regulatory-like domain-containing protein [Deltaproteobacteria bacterium]